MIDIEVIDLDLEVVDLTVDEEPFDLFKYKTFEEYVEEYINMNAEVQDVEILEFADIVMMDL